MVEARIDQASLPTTLSHNGLPIGCDDGCRWESTKSCGNLLGMAIKTKVLVFLPLVMDKEKYCGELTVMPAPGLVRTISPPHALHRAMDELPFVKIGEGAELQLLQVNIEAGLWVIRTRLFPGITLPKHKHTGEVFAFTIVGRWKYLEYPEVSKAGSYLYEPAGSIHTLHTPKDNEGLTDVWFAIRGANLEYNADGEIEAVIDAAAALEIYRNLCKESGCGEPNVIGG